jgi:stage II sporulation protein D
MLKKVLFCLMLMLGFVSIAAADVEGTAAVPVIRVGLWSNQVNVMLSADSDFNIIDTESTEVIGQFRSKEKVTVSVKDDQITVNGRTVGAQGLSIVPTGGGPNFIEVNRRHYRGTVAIHRTHGKTGLTVVNTLPLEEYLYGVIPREISPAWPVEAVKAQAVAARTYALYSMNKYREDGYDVNTSTDCQVYGGRDNEDAKSNRAVDDTFGQVIIYQGKIIPAFFHASGGGYTESNENVWGGNQPFLRGVVDYDENSPHYRWEKQILPKDIDAALLSAGYNIGHLQAIELSPLGKPPVNSPDRGVSGRVKTLSLVGTTGNVQISGSKLRTILGLNSTLFDIKIILQTEKSFEVEVTDSYGDRDVKIVDMNLPPVSPKPLATDKGTIRRLSGRPNEIIVISGFGWGHGLGMSQWGAKAMAEKAPAGDTAYFKEILKHYYTGVDIHKAY